MRAPAHQLTFALLILTAIAGICWPAITSHSRPGSSKIFDENRDILMEHCIAEGKNLFDKNCRVCHNPYKTDYMPNLSVAISGEPYENFFVDFVFNADSMVLNNRYAREMYGHYGSAQPPFKNVLSAAEIKEIEAFIIYDEKMRNKQ